MEEKFSHSSLKRVIASVFTVSCTFIFEIEICVWCLSICFVLFGLFFKYFSSGIKLEAKNTTICTAAVLTYRTLRRSGAAELCPYVCANSFTVELKVRKRWYSDRLGFSKGRMVWEGR